MTPLARHVRELGLAARAAVGAEDLAVLRRTKLSCIAAELVGRLLLHFAAGPFGWLFGTLLLAYHLSAEAHLNHTLMHGALVGVPGAGRLLPSRYETLAIPFRSKTWRDAHHVHHVNPSLLGLDPDTEHPLFRMHASQRLRWWHRGNAFIGAFFTFEHWAFDYDAFLKRNGLRARGDRGELVKFAVYLGYQLALFPLLAGPRWLPVLLAGLAAIVIRNLIFTALQTGSSVGHRVSTVHAGGSKIDRVRFQIETSKNFVLGRLGRFLCGGLDRHIEHHLWPHLPPQRLHALSAPVKQLCREHGVQYVEFPSLAASLRDSVTYLHARGRSE